MGFAAVYVHVPFCLRKCQYCDFLSYPGKPKTDVMAEYTNQIKKEFILWQNIMAKTPIFTPGENITVYFGGGTPSLMPPAFFREILKQIADIAATCGARVDEVTVEINPGTVDISYLTALKEAGVNRISIGVQSFYDKDLALMGRIHKGVDAAVAVKLCRECGFDNVSLDLIYDLPGQTVVSWLENLKQAVSLGIEHLSCYGLHLSSQSPWGLCYEKGMLSLPDEEEEVAMWAAGREFLQNQGFAQYEISNFAKTGRECRHNLKYWHRENYLGLGLGAASCYREHRWSNQETFVLYEAALAKQTVPIDFHEVLTPEVLWAEGVFLGLRCLAGIDFAHFRAKYGVDISSYYKKTIDDLAKKGLLQVDDTGIKLTEKGLLLANTVFADFLPESSAKN